MSVRPVTTEKICYSNNSATKTQNSKTGHIHFQCNSRPEVTGELSWALVLLGTVYHGTPILRKWNENQLQSESFSVSLLALIPFHPNAPEQLSSDRTTILCTIVHINILAFWPMYLKAKLIQDIQRVCLQHVGEG